MHSRNDFYVGFMRGLNPIAELFAPYRGAYEGSSGGRVRSDWADGHEGVRTALGVAFAKIAPGSSGRQLAQGRRSSRTIRRFVSWRDWLPPATELERIEQTTPGGVDRLLRMAEQDLQMAQKEQTHRFEDSRRGQYLGFSLAAGVVIAATVASLFHAPWQVSVGLVGIPMLGAVQALIQGRREKRTQRSARWLERWFEREER